MTPQQCLTHSLSRTLLSGITASLLLAVTAAALFPVQAQAQTIPASTPATASDEQNLRLAENASYRHSLARWMNRKIYIPDACVQEHCPPGTVLLSLDIDKAGHVHALRRHSTTGNFYLDAAATGTFQNATLPALPGIFPDLRYTIFIRVLYTSSADTPQKLTAHYSLIPAPHPAPASADMQAYGKHVMDWIHARQTYPDNARQAGEQGSCSVYVVINAAGSVKSVRLEKSTGFADLDRATIALFAGQQMPAVPDAIIKKNGSLGHYDIETTITYTLPSQPVSDHTPR
ncbi:energy transducer TonB [Acetobacter persici]|uniref:energy transducer TonB n=2 Tax=Acetobacter persici TaxID=1076596 RepID=UPI001F1AE59C|nr:energy transducer TonB [Acetobacter persici]MCG0998541.1 energy transducer TonB [Acetobacter persici]